MMTNTRLACLVIAVLVGSAAFPRVLHAQQRSGVEIWAATCGSCHLMQPASRYTAKDWDAIGTHMVITARLTTAQADAVMEFLKTNAARQDAGEQNAAAKTTPAETRRPDRAVLTPEQLAAARKYIRQLTVRR